MQNLINKNYEEKFNNTESSVESELLNKNNINNKENKLQINSKNSFNSKIIKIITSIENKKNQYLLKNYFKIFHSLLDNKIEKQEKLLGKKNDVLKKVPKTISTTENKNDQIVLENSPGEIFDNSKFKNPLDFISPLNFDKIKNDDNFNENIKKIDISNIKLENESSGDSFISIPLVARLYSLNDPNELIKNEDKLFTDQYHKFQNIISSFRLLLIFYSLIKKKSNQD